MWESSLALSVIIPVYNERESLPTLFGQLRGVLDDMGKPYELIFVDDGSQDESGTFLKSISETHSNVNVITLRRNFGQTAALAAGFDRASGDVVVTIDADLQNDPADIPRLLAKLDEGYDIVSGWRKERSDPFLSKSLPSVLSNRLASWLTGVPLHDYGCTLKAYRREVINEIHLYGEMHRYIPAVAASVGVSVAEIEVRHHARAFGKSKYGATRLIRGLLDLVTLRLLMSYTNRPMQLFGGLGMAAMALGIASGFLTLAMKLFMGMDMTGNPLLYFTVFLWVVAFQFIGLGFLGELTTRTYHESQAKPIYVVREVVGAPKVSLDQEQREANAQVQPRA